MKYEVEMLNQKLLLINEEKFIIEKKNTDQELLIQDQQEMLKNYEEELEEIKFKCEDMKLKNMDQVAQIKKLDEELEISIEQAKEQAQKKNSFSLLEEVKNCMNNGLKISQEAMEIDYDPIKTIPSIKFVEGCEDDDDKIDEDQISVKVISDNGSEELGFR